MEFFESLIPIAIVLVCLVGCVALAALAYLLFTLVQVVKDTMVKVNPLLDDAQELTASAKVMAEKAKPAVEKIEPIMDRATLTMDAVNLEIMRVDQLMEDINSITTQVSKATDSLDAVASAPLDFVSKVTTKLRDRIAPYTSVDVKEETIVDSLDFGLYAVGEKVADLQDEAEQRQMDRAEKFEARLQAFEKANKTSSQIKDAAHVQANQTTENILKEGNNC